MAICKGVGRSEEREAYWRGHVEGQGRSGESVRGYCRSLGLSEAAFHFWKRELKRREAGAVLKRGRWAFAEVKVVSSSVHEASIEIACAGSRRVRVHPGFDEDTLVRVLAALERAGARSC